MAILLQSNTTLAPKRLVERGKGKVDEALPHPSSVATRMRELGASWMDAFDAAVWGGALGVVPGQLMQHRKHVHQCGQLLVRAPYHRDGIGYVDGDIDWQRVARKRHRKVVKFLEREGLQEIVCAVLAEVQNVEQLQRRTSTSSGGKI